MVSTIWVSLRNPSGKQGRNGRSVRRQVKIAASVGRPSRRKNEPGILPAAYARSSTSTVSGKKSMPGLTSLAALAVAKTVVRPMEAITAPWDCWASLPVSNVRVLSVPETAPDTRMASAIRAPFKSGAFSLAPRRLERRTVPSRRCRCAGTRGIHRGAPARATDNRSRYPLGWLVGSQNNRDRCAPYQQTGDNQRHRCHCRCPTQAGSVLATISRCTLNA